MLPPSWPSYSVCCQPHGTLASRAMLPRFTHLPPAAAPQAAPTLQPRPVSPSKRAQPLVARVVDIDVEVHQVGAGGAARDGRPRLEQQPGQLPRSGTMAGIALLLAGMDAGGHWPAMSFSFSCARTQSSTPPIARRRTCSRRTSCSRQMRGNPRQRSQRPRQQQQQ